MKRGGNQYIADAPSTSRPRMNEEPTNKPRRPDNADLSITALESMLKPKLPRPAVLDPVSYLKDLCVKLQMAKPWFKMSTDHKLKRQQRRYIYRVQVGGHVRHGKSPFKQAAKQKAVAKMITFLKSTKSVADDNNYRLKDVDMEPQRKQPIPRPRKVFIPPSVRAHCDLLIGAEEADSDSD